MIYCWSGHQIPRGLAGVRPLVWHMPTDDPAATGRRLAAGDGQDALFLRHVERHTPHITIAEPHTRLVDGAMLEGVFESMVRLFLPMLRGGARGVKHLVVEYEASIGVNYWAIASSGNIPRALALLEQAQQYASANSIPFPLAEYDTTKLNTKAHTFPLAYAWNQLLHDHVCDYLREIARAYEFVFDHECPISNYGFTEFGYDDLNGHPFAVGVPGSISSPRFYLDSTKMGPMHQAERFAHLLAANKDKRIVPWFCGTMRTGRHQWPDDADWVLAQAIAAHCQDCIAWTSQTSKQYTDDLPRGIAREHAATALLAAAYEGVGK